MTTLRGFGDFSNMTSPSMSSTQALNDWCVRYESSTNLSTSSRSDYSRCFQNRNFILNNKDDTNRSTVPSSNRSHADPTSKVRIENSPSSSSNIRKKNQHQNCLTHSELKENRSLEDSNNSRFSDKHKYSISRSFSSNPLNGRHKHDTEDIPAVEEHSSDYLYPNNIAKTAKTPSCFYRGSPTVSQQKSLTLKQIRDLRRVCRKTANRAQFENRLVQIRQISSILSMSLQARPAFFARTSAMRKWIEYHRENGSAWTDEQELSQDVLQELRQWDAILKDNCHPWRFRGQQQRVGSDLFSGPENGTGNLQHNPFQKQQQQQFSKRLDRTHQREGTYQHNRFGYHWSSNQNAVKKWGKTTSKKTRLRDFDAIENPKNKFAAIKPESHMTVHGNPRLTQLPMSIGDDHGNVSHKNEELPGSCTVVSPIQHEKLMLASTSSFKTTMTNTTMTTTSNTNASGISMLDYMPICSGLKQNENLTSHSRIMFEHDQKLFRHIGLSCPTSHEAFNFPSQNNDSSFSSEIFGMCTSPSIDDMSNKVPGLADDNVATGLKKGTEYCAKYAPNNENCHPHFNGQVQKSDVKTFPLGHRSRLYNNLMFLSAEVPKPYTENTQFVYSPSCNAFKMNNLKLEQNQLGYNQNVSILLEDKLYLNEPLTQKHCLVRNDLYMECFSTSRSASEEDFRSEESLETQYSRTSEKQQSEALISHDDDVDTPNPSLSDLLPQSLSDILFDGESLHDDSLEMLTELSNEVVKNDSSEIE